MHFTVEAQGIAARFLAPGAIAIDATAGNGFDTLFLSEAVGESGFVYSIDVQEAAVIIVRRKLEQAGLHTRCRCLVDSHENLLKFLDAKHLGLVSVIMFNLGYLPFGDKTIVTTPATTIAALDQCIEAIRPGGLISVLAYLGHPGGLDEASCVAQWVDRHHRDLEVQRFQDPQNSRSPILWSMTKHHC